MNEMINIESHNPFEAYLCLPDDQPKGAVIVIHEVWGLSDHIKSVAERIAKEGYLALAPELLEDDLDLPEIRQLQNDLFDPAKRHEAQPKLRQLMTPLQNPEFAKKTLGRLQDCFNYLYERSDVNHQVAVIGFCFGGTYSFNLAVSEPRLKVAIPFYGHCEQSVEELSKVTCPIRAFYGEEDERLIEGLDALKQKMSQAKVDFALKVYPDCGHAFFNDSNPFAYNETAAMDAWAISKQTLLNTMSS
jgi:carboxymethylenebutenolidase